MQSQAKACAVAWEEDVINPVTAAELDWSGRCSF
jgi:hypothetical protein